MIHYRQRIFKVIHNIFRHFFALFMEDIMINDLDILETYINIIKKQTSLVPDIAIILGSGLNSFIKMVNIDAEISYSSLPDFPTCTNKMHKGRFIIGTIENKNVIIADGRLHYYTGYYACSYNETSRGKNTCYYKCCRWNK